MILATSYERLRRYLSNTQDTPLTDTQYLKRDLVNWVTSVTRAFEKYLNRSFSKESRTEYFDVHYSKQRFYPQGIPVSSISNIYYDEYGIYDGTSETELDGDNDFIIGSEGDTVFLNYPLQFENPKGLKIVYNGGLAVHGTQSTFALTTGNTFTAGRYVLGSTSMAMGIVVSQSVKSLILDNLRGVFEASETITEYTNEACSSGGSVTDVISSITYQSLAEAYPDITTAAEMQIRYMYKHKDDFELVGSTRDATNLRRNNERPEQRFVAEVINMLSPYRRIHGR